MDDRRFGAALRAARIRRGWRQTDLAARAKVAPSTVSRIEHGFVGSSLPTVRGVAAALDVGVELLPRSRGADLDRLINARHAALVDATLVRFRGPTAWEIRPEVSFSIYGERGVVDAIAWHAPARAVLLLECKTEIVDVGAILSTLDRRDRLAGRIVERFGWRPRTVSTLLVVADSRTNRRRVSEHRASLRAALPADGRTAWAWIARPIGTLRALAFLTDSHTRGTRGGLATPRRVSRPREPTSPAPPGRP